ncbi:MAG: hypothetical protein KME64_01805 [Scytonematopsis contorta HA4267-MV1]|jgi:hypothetical protein|nr:hypothetical protein [Scytonematopsis contorta HA4267-MV1]
MSQLKITDISFFESELSSSNQVQGGSRTVASVSNSFSADTYAQYSGSWFAYNDGSGYRIIANTYANAGGAVAGAASGAASDGTVYTSSYANATARF